MESSLLLERSKWVTEFASLKSNLLRLPIWLWLRLIDFNWLSPRKSRGGTERIWFFERLISEIIWFLTNKSKGRFLRKFSEKSAVWSRKAPELDLSEITKSCLSKWQFCDINRNCEINCFHGLGQITGRAVRDTEIAGVKFAAARKVHKPKSPRCTIKMGAY